MEGLIEEKKSDCECWQGVGVGVGGGVLHRGDRKCEDSKGGMAWCVQATEIKMTILARD